MTQTNLDRLNAFRAAEGKPAFADWRKARHQPMLDAYEQAKADAEYAERKRAEDEAKATREAEEAALIEAANKPAKRTNKKGARDWKSSELAAVAGQADFAHHEALNKAATEVASAKSYKEVANYDKSAVDRPVSFVHAFLDNNPGLSRKAAVIALCEGYGVNYSTARTQYQRWFSAKKKGQG